MMGHSSRDRRAIWLCHKSFVSVQKSGAEKATKNDENVGSSFYEFVQEESIHEDEREVAIKRIVD